MKIVKILIKQNGCFGHALGNARYHGKNISIIRNTSYVISGWACEYYGDSDRLKEWYKRAEEKYAK